MWKYHVTCLLLRHKDCPHLHRLTVPTVAEGETTGEVSPEKVAQAVKRVNAALELIKGMKHSLTSAVTSIESVKQDLDTLREEVSDAMGDLGRPRADSEDVGQVHGSVRGPALR